MGRAPSEDPYETLVPDGEYDVVFVRQEKFWMHRRQVWGVTYLIVADDHQGLPVRGFYNIPPMRSGRTPSAKLSQDFEITTGRRAPTKIARVKPSAFLEGCIVRAKLRTVDRNANGVERPEGARYSVVDHLIRRLDGVPPAIRTRRNTESTPQPES